MARETREISGRQKSQTHSPGRRQPQAVRPTSDRQPADAKPAPGASPGGRSATRLSRRTGASLRLKFMLTMAVITAVTMVLLGVTMYGRASSFLVGEKLRDGVEVAKLAAQIAVVVQTKVEIYRANPNLVDGKFKLQDKIREEIKELLTSARKWGESEEASDLESVLISAPNAPDISAAGIGVDQGVTIGNRLTRIFVPKLNRDVALPPGIEVYEGVKNLKNGSIPIYRFKIALDPKVFRAGADIRVDVAAASIQEVRSNLAVTIFIAVLIAIALSTVVAHFLASTITKPLELLMRDMAVVTGGDLNHQTKAKSTDEIGVLAAEFNKMTTSLKEAQAVLVEQEKAAYELSIAREVQRQLLPAESPLLDGYQVDAYYLGAKAVSGDYYDFIPLGEGKLGFIVADVSGKGIPGSMVMAVTRTIVRLVAQQHNEDAASTLKDTNRLIAKQIKRGMFVTAFYAVLDLPTGVLTYASAGHNPMVITRGPGKPPELATAKGIALGFNEGPIFDKTIQTGRIQLGAGHSFILYTDGFPEAMNDRNEEYTEEKFYALCGAAGQLDAKSATKAIVDGIARHRGDAEQSDDLTLIVVKRS